MAAADVLPMVPWLIFLACIAVIGWRVLSGRARPKEGAETAETGDQEEGDAGNTMAKGYLPAAAPRWRWPRRRGRPTMGP